MPEMKFEDHCRECREKLLAPFADVHTWLDEYAGSPKYGMRHRRVRHHEEGIAQAIVLFGKEGGEAARLHIISDLKEEGWKDGDRFRRDVIYRKDNPA
jgi:hypothetical protein